MSQEYIGAKANFKKQATKYTILNGVLHFKYREHKKSLHGPDILKVIADPESRKQYIKGAHEGLGSSTKAKAIGGHLGRDKTLWKLYDSGFWWPGMNTEVRKFVSCCDACQKAGTKMDKATPSLHPVSVPQHAYICVDADKCGPL